MKMMLFTPIFLFLIFGLFLDTHASAYATTPVAKTHNKKLTSHPKSVKGMATSMEVPVKNEFTIAVYGDSMEDTMGESVD